MGSKAQAKANSENAKRMKDLGIRRTTTRCPVCNKIVRLPYDPRNHGCRTTA